MPGEHEAPARLQSREVRRVETERVFYARGKQGFNRLRLSPLPGISQGPRDTLSHCGSESELHPCQSFPRAAASKTKDLTSWEYCEKSLVSRQLYRA
jgi:hypothetical protein